MPGFTWEYDLGPSIVQYWTAVKRIYELSALKGFSNATVNTMAVAILGELVSTNGGTWANSTPAANALLLACAASIASNTFVGGA